MENRYTPRVPFEFRMRPKEVISAIMYLPVHIFLLPTLLAGMMLKGSISEADANFLIYGMGVCFVLSSCFAYLRAEFDPLCDHPFYVVFQVIGHYGLMLLMNFAVNTVLLSIAFTSENPNNAAVFDMAGVEFKKMLVLSVFMAPIVEEVIFRGAIFGSIREKSRLAAYLVSVFLFALYHVWGFLAFDWRYIIFIFQYVPISYLLCRIYERTSSLWASIFLHMLVNAVSINLMEAIGGLI